VPVVNSRNSSASSSGSNASAWVRASSAHSASPGGQHHTHLDPCGVASETTQRREAAVAVDEHEALGGVRRRGLVGHGEERAALTVALERAHQRLEAPGAPEAHRRIAQLQAVRLELDDGGGCAVHARDGTSTPALRLSSPLFASAAGRCVSA